MKIDLFVATLGERLGKAIVSALLCAYRAFSSRCGMLLRSH